METTVIYDTYISNYFESSSKNFGSESNVMITNYNKYNETLRYSLPAHGMYYWDVSMLDIASFKLALRIQNLEVKDKVLGQLTGLTFKFDLYAVAEKFNEKTVTWDNAPKTQLLKENFLVVPVINSSIGNIITLDLTPYVDDIKNGIMLKMNSFFKTDLESQYPGVVPDVAHLSLHSSESAYPPVLTYNYGEKPLAPNIISPIWGSIVNKKDTSNIRFEWTSSGQTNYEFEYSQDNYNWTKLQGTTSKYVNVPTSGLNNGNLYARVRIKAGGMWSNYSQVWFLQIGEKPNAPVVSISAITTSTPTVSWNSNALQNKYQVQVLQGSQLIIDSEEVESKEYRYILKERLEDNKFYTFKVRIADENDIWSDWGTKTATIKFTKPAIPSFTLYLNPGRGFTLINIEKSAGGGESTIYNDVFRKIGDEEWIRIATNVVDSYSDYSIRAIEDVHYKVRAIGQNGYNDSLAKSVYFSMRYNDLAIVGEWDKYIKLKYNERKKQNQGYSGEILKFAGRKGSVVEFDDNYDNSLALEFEITSKKDLEMLQYIIDSRKTLLFRDRKGRKLYGSIISKLNIEDTRLRTYVVDFTFTETDFNEVV